MNCYNNKTYRLIVFTAGVLITIMNLFNSKIGEITNPILGSGITHLLGVPVIIFLLMFDNKVSSAKTKKTGSMSKGGLVLSNFLPYFVGILGALMVVIANILIPMLGLGATVCSFILGNLLSSVIFDYLGISTGLSVPISSKTIFSLILILCGVVLIKDGSVSNISDLHLVFLSMLNGTVCSLSGILNSKLAIKHGMSKGLLINHTGAILFVIFYIVIRQQYTFSYIPWYLFLTGIIGVAVVAICNKAIPKIGLLNTTTMILLGQATMGTILTSNITLVYIVGFVIFSLGVILSLQKSSRNQEMVIN